MMGTTIDGALGWLLGHSLFLAIIVLTVILFVRKKAARFPTILGILTGIVLLVLIPTFGRWVIDLLNNMAGAVTNAHG